MGLNSATAKSQSGRSGKRPSMDNLKIFSLRKQDKTSHTPEASDRLLNDSPQQSMAMLAQSKGHRSGQGRPSSNSVMTGTATEQQHQEWYKDENLKVRLRLNGLRLHDPTKKSSSALAYLGKLVLDRSGDVYTSTQVDELGEDW
ncbi:MAG: hypothetical protein LQ347_001767 [Umbilicaria vellea]|nr:MAG: hypothetical protein LQ347_001767 [Umbilicaria vellea]